MQIGQSLNMLSASRSFPSELLIHKLMIHRKGSRNMKYKKISHEQRAHVIKELTENGKTLKEVSEETQLKPSTVKAIL